jgi:hypothetical protein
MNLMLRTTSVLLVLLIQILSYRTSLLAVCLTIPQKHQRLIAQKPLPRTYINALLIAANQPVQIYDQKIACNLFPACRLMMTK